MCPTKAEVIVYSAHESICVPCRETEEFLRAHQIPYERKDIVEDPEALEEFLAITNGAESVPVLRVGRKILVGFDAGILRRELGLDD